MNMVKINGQVYERADYCKILPSGSPQICTTGATNILTETGNVFPIDTPIESLTVDSVSDMSTALDILGVTE